MSDFYFSKIETFNNKEVINPTNSLKLRRQKEKHDRKLGNMGLFRGNNPKKLLEKVKESESKLRELEKENPLEAELFKQKQKWQLASFRAKGIKIKNDTSLLKKSIKKQESMKKRSTKKWEKRKETVRKAQEDKQKKRRDNLLARRDVKKKKRFKKLVKKGHIIPEISKDS